MHLVVISLYVALKSQVNLSLGKPSIYMMNVEQLQLLSVIEHLLSTSKGGN